MENLIVEKVGFIKEATYQRIKKEMNKKDDYFYKNELIHGGNVIKTSQIFPKSVWDNVEMNKKEKCGKHWKIKENKNE